MEELAAVHRMTRLMMFLRRTARQDQFGLHRHVIELHLTRETLRCAHRYTGPSVRRSGEDVTFRLALIGDHWGARSLLDLPRKTQAEIVAVAGGAERLKRAARVHCEPELPC